MIPTSLFADHEPIDVTYYFDYYPDRPITSGRIHIPPQQGDWIAIPRPQLPLFAQDIPVSLATGIAEKVEDYGDRFVIRIHPLQIGLRYKDLQDYVGEPGVGYSAQFGRVEGTLLQCEIVRGAACIEAPALMNVLNGIEEAKGFSPGDDAAIWVNAITFLPDAVRKKNPFQPHTPATLPPSPPPSEMPQTAARLHNGQMLMRGISYNPPPHLR